MMTYHKYREVRPIASKPTMPADDPHLRRAHTRREAEIDHIVATLRPYRVLTRARLAHLCGAVHWSQPDFRRALALAVSSGRVKALSRELYEITEP
jgi:hypothetical protein